MSGEINGGMDLGTMCEGIEFGSAAKNLHGLCVQRHRECDDILKKAHGGCERHLFMFGVMEPSLCLVHAYADPPCLPSRHFCENRTYKHWKWERASWSSISFRHSTQQLVHTIAKGLGKADKEKS